MTVPSALEVLIDALPPLTHGGQGYYQEAVASNLLDALSAAGYVIVPRWLLIGLVDCHEFPSSERCEFVAEARRTLAPEANTE